MHSTAPNERWPPHPMKDAHPTQWKMPNPTRWKMATPSIERWPPRPMKDGHPARWKMANPAQWKMANPAQWTMERVNEGKERTSIWKDMSCFSWETLVVSFQIFMSQGHRMHTSRHLCICKPCNLQWIPGTSLGTCLRPSFFMYFQIPNLVSFIVLWISSNRIERSNLDGNYREVIVDISVRPFSVAVFGNYIYWSDWSIRK